MFCSNCGEKIADKAVICVHCGCKTQNNIFNSSEKSTALGLVLWFFLGQLGAHRFYYGDKHNGAMMLALTILGWLTIFIFIGAIPLLVVVIWWFCDLFWVIDDNKTQKCVNKSKQHNEYTEDKYYGRNDDSLLSSIGIVLLILFVCFIMFKLTDIASNINADIKQLKNNTFYYHN